MRPTVGGSSRRASPPTASSSPATASSRVGRRGRSPASRRCSASSRSASGQPAPARTVERDGKLVERTSVTPDGSTESRELDIVEHTGRIGFDPRFPARSSASRGATRRPQRRASHLRPRHGRRTGGASSAFADLVDRSSRENRGDQVPVSFLRPVDVPNALGGLGELAVLEPGAAHAHPRLPERRAWHLPIDARRACRRRRSQRTGIESADMYVAFVPEGSSEWKRAPAWHRATASRRSTALPQRSWMHA